MHFATTLELDDFTAVQDGQKARALDTGIDYEWITAAGGWVKLTNADEVASLVESSSTRLFPVEGSPDPDLGSVNDLAFAPSTSDVWFKFTDAGWTWIGNLKGITGDAGATGSTGATGAAGTPASNAFVMALIGDYAASWVAH
jgi:hypothetical protein